MAIRSATGFIGECEYFHLSHEHVHTVLDTSMLQTVHMYTCTIVVCLLLENMFTASPTEAWSEQSAASEPQLSLDLRQNPLKDHIHCWGGAQFVTMVTHSGQQQHIHRGVCNCFIKNSTLHTR